MSYLRSQHIFAGLMGVSVVVGFLVPPQHARRFVPQIQSLFTPVAWPAGSIAAAVRDRVSPTTGNDTRTVRDIQSENQQLRTDVALLRMQLDEMYRRDAELMKLGPVKNFCRLFKVVGGDAGTRESIAIAGSSLEGVRNEQYVVYAGGLVGQVQQAGPGGAQVRLITDPGSRLRVRFVRFSKVNGETTFEPLGTPVVLAEGAGNGTLVVRALSLAEIGYDADGKPIGKGDTLRESTDYAVLFDGDCPRPLQGETIGRITRISQRRDARLFAEVRLEPNTNLKRLREVMVMTKEN